MWAMKLHVRRRREGGRRGRENGKGNRGEDYVINNARWAGQMLSFR